MNRALRRHHEQRMKDRFYDKQRKNPFWGNTGPKAAGVYANHKCVCSCAMCGNPRRHFGERSMQEKRAGWR